MSEESRVLTELDDEGVLLVTMNRPEKKNAFDEDQWDAFCQALRDAEADPRVAVVVLTGAGGNFSSGADLGGFGGGFRGQGGVGQPDEHVDGVDRLCSSRCF